MDDQLAHLVPVMDARCIGEDYSKHRRFYGRANGLYFDSNGNLLACADLNNELWLIDKQGNVTVLVKLFGGKKLNGPNDLWVGSTGGIYFTDPFYKRPYWKRGPMEQDGQHVYYLGSQQKEPVRLTHDLVQPNGIVGTPDGKHLYVADIGDRKTYVYDIQPDGFNESWGEVRNPQLWSNSS